MAPRFPQVGGIRFKNYPFIFARRERERERKREKERKRESSKELPPEELQEECNWPRNWGTNPGLVGSRAHQLASLFPLCFTPKQAVAIIVDSAALRDRPPIDSNRGQ